ncbi:MAG: DUF6291 domain-containing protein [Clostridia bacterium]|nr:DUF6291 domain-containing protein [Clostridia bacterium]
MFTDNPIEPPQDDKQDFIWSITEEYLCKTKAKETEGKTPKTFNSKFAHFAFDKSYYKAIKLMTDEQSGSYIKAICGYMFDGEEPAKIKPPVTEYYELAKLKLNQSKARQNSGRKGGKAERKKVTDEQIAGMTKDGGNHPFDDFMNQFTHIKNDIYEKSKYLLEGVDWELLGWKLKENEKYKNCTSLYQFLMHRAEIENE